MAMSRGFSRTGNVPEGTNIRPAGELQGYSGAVSRPEKITAAQEIFTGLLEKWMDELYGNREKQRNIGDSGWKSHTPSDWHAS